LKQQNKFVHHISESSRFQKMVTMTLDPERKNAQPLGIPPLEDHSLNQLNQTAEPQPSIERHIQHAGSNKALHATR